jgi:lysozyme family protein
MANFEKAITRVLRWEGGLVDDADDRGGRTNFGISQASYPDLDIASLTLDEAKAIYKRDYWDRIQAWAISDQSLAEALLDAAVNHGQTRAIRLLQLEAGVEPDGRVGPVTLRAINAQPDLLPRLLLRRIGLVLDIARRDSSQRKFLVGWIRRILSYG